MRGTGPWLRLWPVWAVPALVLGLNVAWVAGIRGAVLGRGTSLATRVSGLSEECSRLESQLQGLTATRSDLDRLRQNLVSLRTEKLAGMKDRLVPFITEVVKLAMDAGIQPERVAYSAQKEEKTGLVLFTASYSVTASYEQIRRLVFLLESSPEFILLEGLGIQGDEGSSSTVVSVVFNLATYFADMDRQLMKQMGVQEVPSTSPEPPAASSKGPGGEGTDAF